LALEVLSDCAEEFLEFLVVFGFVNFPQRLVEVQFVVGSAQKTFDGADFGLAVDRDFQVKFFEVNFGVFGLDDFPVEILLGKDPEEDDHAVIRQFTGKLDFIVAISALFAEERGEYDFPEEGDFGHEESGGAILLAVHTETFDDGG
jgi:hypothetical protein